MERKIWEAKLFAMVSSRQKPPEPPRRAKGKKEQGHAMPSAGMLAALGMGPAKHNGDNAD